MQRYYDDELARKDEHQPDVALNPLCWFAEEGEIAFVRIITADRTASR